MGYYTYYDLRVWDAECRDDHPQSDEIIADLRADCGDAVYALGATGSSGDHATWYEHVRDMAAFSQKYPDAVFDLHGEGESSEDLWRKYFKNGRVQLAPAKIEYDEFDESQLQEVED